MRQIEHPNIVKLIDFAEARQYYYIVLELCPGGELFHQIVRLTYFSEDLSRHIILQVAQAIEYLHETSGVVHRYAGPLPPPRAAALCLIGNANPHAEISSQRTFCSTLHRLSPANTPSPPSRAMKIKQTRASSFPG